MKYEDYEKLLDEAVTNADTAPANIVSVKEALKADLDVIGTMEASITEKDAQIKSLQDTNLKLYMAQGGGGSDDNNDDDDDDVPGIDWDKLIEEE